MIGAIRNAASIGRYGWEQIKARPGGSGKVCSEPEEDQDMKTLRKKPSAARSASYGLVLFAISAGGFFQAPLLLGRVTRAGILSAFRGKAALSTALQAGEDHHV